jgi:uncharacterized protein with PIN domain
VTQKEHARNLLNAAVRRGRIIKPSECSQCGKAFSRFHIQAHHEDYALPYKVFWVCATCHAKLDDQSSKGWRRSKTHCVRGHRYTPDNVYLEHGKWRVCRVCLRVKWRERQKSRREGDRIAGAGRQVSDAIDTQHKILYQGYTCAPTHGVKVDGIGQ